MYTGIYIRVSTEEQTDGYSLAAQERACRAYAELRGWTVAAVYADEGDSAFKDRLAERPALRRLIADYRSRVIGAVIVHKLDRFFRRTALLLQTVEDMEQRDVVFVSVTEQIDFSTPIGRVMLTNIGAFAEYYSRNLSFETKKGLREKAEQGRWVVPCHSATTAALRGCWCRPPMLRRCNVSLPCTLLGSTRTLRSPMI